MPNVRVGVGCMVVHQDLLLMLKRTGSHGASTWSVPGGHMEWGETPEQTALREVREETGLDVSITGRLAYTNDPMPEADMHYATLYVLARYLGGKSEVKEPEKCLEVRWVPLTDVPGMDLFAPLSHFFADNPDWAAQYRGGPPDVMRLRAAETMAAAIDYYVQLGLLDARSVPADARLGFGNPGDPESTLKLLQERGIIR